MKHPCCDSCRINYPLVSREVKKIACEYCRGENSNYERIRPDDVKRLAEMKREKSREGKIITPR